MHAALLIALSLVAAEPRPAKASRVERPKSGAPNWGGILQAPQSHNDRPITGTVSRMGLEQPAQPPADVERGGWAEEEANGRAPIKDKEPESAPFKPGPAFRKVIQRDRAAEVARYRAERARSRYGRQQGMSTHDAYQNAAMRAVRQVQGW